MDRAALKREAIRWFRSRMAADGWLDDLRAQARPLKAVSANPTTAKTSKRTRSRSNAA